MKHPLCFLFLLFLLQSSSSSSSSSASVSSAAKDVPSPKYFKQPVDHFNASSHPSSSSSSFFLQKYFVNDAHYKPGGPLLFYCGPEASLSPASVMDGVIAFAAYAARLNALLVSAEHRYFGESLPFGPEPSFAPENVVFLTVEQTLADYVAIIQHVQQRYMSSSSSLSSSNTKVFTFGGSYGGFLAMLMRAKHPTVVNGGAIASAAALYTVGDVSNSTWFDHVSQTFNSVPFLPTEKSCGEAVRGEFEQVYQQRYNGTLRKELKKRYRLCEEVSSSSDVFRLLLTARNAFASVAEFNYPIANPPFRLANPLQVLCQQRNEDAERGLIGLALDMYYNATKDLPCLSFLPSSSSSSLLSSQPSSSSSSRLFSLQHAKKDPLPIERKPWSYLCCQQFVQPIAGTGIFAVPSPYNYSLMVEYCKKEWPGVKASFDPLSWWRGFVSPILDFDATTMQGASRILWVNGGYDPVRAFSPRAKDMDGDEEMKQRELKAIDVEKMAHTYDLFAEREMADPPQVKEARRFTFQTIQRWLKQ
ncbi:Dipeptidyl peptidase 2 [Balamuthia mandrillaris]